MKIDSQVLMDIISKALLVKAGSFDANIKENFLVMAVITASVKVNWSSLLFYVLVDMIGKYFTGFVVYLNKLFNVLEVSIYATQYLSKTKMLDSAYVLALCPKVSAVPLATVKKELGEVQGSATKNKPKKKLILPSDYE